MQIRLDQRVAVITGGAQGIGKATARAMLEAGASVLIVDSDEEALTQTQQELAALGPIDIKRGDVGLEQDVQRTVQHALHRFGRLDVVVNNAGIARSKPVTELTLEEWNRVLAVNVTSIFLFARYAADHLRAHDQGAMVNIASTRAVQSEANTEAYSASKGAVVGITHALAISLGPAVRVNCISPGWIETAAWKKASRRREPSHTDADRTQHPVGRVGVPEDVADMVVYLASSRAGFITGQNFTMDGGMTRKMIYV